ncbi:MAG: hypothetical protein CVV17_00760 [Gammaproteobacteria bacterium HGW-Gammaproteobacteria-7]|nr:MAG: hypothetical protein CVV17_00760 [Gammaproteobacteria bacterium HGW-Gammaproteobacteria-7]
MPSSISSSDHEAVYQRPLPALGASAWLALVVMLLLMAGWEAWVRAQGVTPSYRNSEDLWAEQRRRIDRGEGDGWVLTGSSRTLFDVQLGVWEQLDGRRPIQLALEGTSPVAVIEGLADDPDFTGKLLVGVAPGLFFSGYEYRRPAIERYATQTPAQWLGHRISLWVEPWLAFYESDFALPVILRRQPLSNRDGVEFDPEVRKLVNLERDRNARMWDRVEYDETYRELARSIWAYGWKPLAERPPAVQKRIAEARVKQLDRAVAAVEKLTARGVPVVFVQLPYEGHYATAEPNIAPRESTWDRLIERTGAIGLHFEDHREMQGYWLPEWSHMSASEADRFTARLYPLIQRALAERTRGESK